MRCCMSKQAEWVGAATHYILRGEGEKERSKYSLSIGHQRRWKNSRKARGEHSPSGVRLNQGTVRMMDFSLVNKERLEKERDRQGRR